jgi:hypothetical protein
MKKLKDIVLGIWDIGSSTVILLLIGFTISVSLCLFIIAVFFIFSFCAPWICIFLRFYESYEANEKDD